MKKSFLSVVLAVIATGAHASGFALYEASAPTYALGGAVVGRAYDASANFFNPATLTDLTNLTVTAGFMTEHPRGRMKTDYPGGHTSDMNPGPFLLPAFHLAVPLPYDFSFGLGIMPEYGLGSQYDDGWDLAFNSTETTVLSFTVNPNLAYRLTDRWSVGAGLRFLYFDFEQYSHPFVAGSYRFHNRLKGDNDMGDFGYQIGTKYDVFDNFAVGVVYKSHTLVHVKGSTANTSDSPALAGTAAAASGSAETELDLPQSVTAGFNWNVTDVWHLGGAVSWTEWSSVGVLDFDLNGTHKDIRLNWDDTWRVSLAQGWDFAEDWSWLASYVYETDCCGSQDSTMLPPSERHMLSTGLVWHCGENWDFGLTYGLILMDGKPSDCTQTASGITYRYRAYRALSHAAGFTVTYRF